MSEAKFICIDTAGERRNSVLVLQFGTPTRSNEKIWKKVLHLIFFGESWRMLGQNSSSIPTTLEVRDTLKCEPGKKEV